ncbi:MAG: hypothetical protein R3220_09125 [Balneolaceae bacterium]|nr:hypothetical protein [Balneolaceae bacterium]
MGGDSCGSSPYSWQTVGNPKVFKVQDFLIGCTSSFRMIDLLAYNLKVERSHPDDSDDLFMRTTFIEGVRKCLKDGGYGKDSEGGNFLVGYNKRLYEVQNDYSILNCPEWGASVGSGEDAARGSLWTTRNDKDPKKRVLTALEAAEAVVPSVRGPMIVLDL